MLKTNVEMSRKQYRFIERDLNICTEYMAFDIDHLHVYSDRLAHILLRLGIEVLRVFSLFLLDENTSKSFPKKPELKNQVLELQAKIERRHDNIYHYLNIVSHWEMKCVYVKALNKFIIPFKKEPLRIPPSEKERKVIPWWEHGYNALRHRIIREFKKSATLQNTLFGLGALWILHDALDSRHMRIGLAESNFFGAIKNKERIEESLILDYELFLLEACAR